MIRTIQCVACDETRAARQKEGELVPYRDICPNCGSEDWLDPVEDG